MNQSGRPRQIRCVRVTGVVQGVGFRPFVVKLAKSCNLRGSVSNKGSFVEIILQGDEFTFETFISRLKNEKPPLSVIEAIEISSLDPLDHLLTDFVVVDSVPSSSLTTSYIPPDMAMCDRCLTDMTRGDRAERKRYPFTSCVDCGPRFTIIRSLPYDRRTTAMKDFPLCQECEIEYNGLEDRRYQAQTTCCSTCGPRYTLYDSDRNPITTSDEEIAGLTSRLLTEGSIVAVKGIGGTHLACEATSDTPTNRLRKSKGDRKRKPFAIMSKNIKEIRKFAVIEFDWIEELLLSPQRPIVLLPKRHPFTLSSEISPGLHNVGVMLPYAGIHHLLLEHPQMSNFVMTSANRSHLPIQINNNLIFSDLKGVADYFLLHNRTIDQRADDSVIKPLIQLTECTGKQNSVFIRRSRGFTPMPISIDDWEWDHAIVGLSSELHTAAAIAFRKRLFLTQYVGSLHYQESQEFLVSAITHLRKLFQNPTIEALVGDLHPGYYSTELGRQLADQLG
ncbi:MAG TPA: carbamoyltransferase HypF, partial [Candidatus Hodarchaeales archaeon]|nr:carbamoyltransferase HypF [Candidatus Hodarchaeales archaeon]